MPDFFDQRGEIDRTQHNLPHWQQGETWVFVTWRLADSVPQDKLREWKNQREAWLTHHPKPWDAAVQEEHQTRFIDPYEEWLDRGSGSCLLRESAMREIVASALLYFNHDRYRIRSFVIMPNHVHVLFQPLAEYALSSILQSWKRHSARQINQRENRSGALWQPEYFDRLIRSADHFDYVVDYIRRNPIQLPEGEFSLYPPAES